MTDTIYRTMAWQNNVETIIIEIIRRKKIANLNKRAPSICCNMFNVWHVHCASNLTRLSRTNEHNSRKKTRDT